MADEMKAMQSLLDFLKPDWAKADKAKLKSASELLVAGMKGTTTWPGDFDDTLWDMLGNVINGLVDKLGVADVHPVVGAEAPVPMSAINEFFALHKIDKGSEVGRELLRHPRAIGLLRDNFTEAEQAQVVGNPFLIGLLTILGPLVLDLIKAWLAKRNKPVKAAAAPAATKLTA